MKGKIKSVYKATYELYVIQKFSKFQRFSLFPSNVVGQENILNDLYSLGEISSVPLGKAKLQIKF